MFWVLDRNVTVYHMRQWLVANFHIRAPAMAKVRSPTVAHCDWWTSSWCVSDDRRRCLDGMSDKHRRSAAR